MIAGNAETSTEATRMHMLDHKIPPPLVFLATAGGMWGLARFTPMLPIDNVARIAVAVVFMAVAAAYAFPAFVAFRRANTTIDPVRIDSAASLVTSGIYRFTRNPMYAGLAALLVGWAVWLAAPWALIGPAFFVLYITRFQIIPEERALQAKFGADYEDYRRKVRRWI
jgi:protein-S-isoprenylcysteine O-methyltransferase Ste14